MKSRRALWAPALAIFAVSALHLSHMEEGIASWPVELLGHHASVPLAFAILYENYRFALADIFLKRALAFLAVVSVTFAAITTFGLQSAAFARFVEVDSREVGILVTLWVATALLYPSLRQLTGWFVDSMLLQRGDYQSLRASVARTAQAHDDVPTLLRDTCALLVPAFSAPRVTWREVRPAGHDDMHAPAVSVGPDAEAVAEAATGDPIDGPVAAVVTVPTADLPRYAIVLGQLAAGRRLLSDDVAALEAIAVMVARRIDAIRITIERHERELREEQIGKLVSEAELRALRAQINPHFLFNALTTIGYLIQTAPPRALETLLRLTALLRGVLRSDGEFTTLGRELEIVRAYLDIEHARFEQRLRATIMVPPALLDIPVPALVLQPLVENAVKHGVAQVEAGGEVSVRATINRLDDGRRELSLVVEDSGVGTTRAALEQGRLAGVGLDNVERRLRCHYGDLASLTIRTAPGTGTLAEVRIPIEIATRRQRGVRRERAL